MWVVRSILIWRKAILTQIITLVCYTDVRVYEGLVIKYRKQIKLLIDYSIFIINNVYHLSAFDEVMIFFFIELAVLAKVEKSTKIKINFLCYWKKKHRLQLSLLWHSIKLKWSLTEIKFTTLSWKKLLYPYIQTS